MTTKDVYSKKAIQTPVGRLSYPSLDKPSTAFSKNQYEATLLFKKEGVDLAALKADLKKLIRAKWGESKNVKDLNLPIKDGDKQKEKKGGEQYADHFVIRLHSKNKPVLKDKDGKTDLDPGAFYPGCNVRAIIKFRTYDNNGEGITAYLNGLQFVGDNDRFGDEVKFEAVDEPDAPAEGEESEEGNQDEFNF